jgi:aldehyde:ferredoxin oxidoreductase
MGSTSEPGRILHVDVATGRYRVEILDAATLRLYPGGGLLGAFLLLRDTPPGLDALAPQTLLLFASSVVGGERAAGLPRFAVVGKSPLTGGIGEARVEGPFGVALREQGCLALAVVGAADEPACLVLAGGVPRLEPAEGLWGLDTSDTADVLGERYPGCHVAAVGPAGEAGVRYASIVTDRSFAAARMGLGAVMGAKNLKAVVLVEGQARPAADPAALTALSRGYGERVLDNALTRWQREPPGFGAWVEGVRLEGYDAVENYRTSVFPGRTGLSVDGFLAHMAWNDGGCPGCPNDCIKGFAVEASASAIERTRARRGGGLHQEPAGTLGPNLGIGDVASVLRLNEACLRLGLDPASLGFTLSFLMEAREGGLVGPAELDGLDLRFGAAEAAEALAARIARREGSGDWLAEGVRRASAALPAAARRLALEVKGLEMTPADPRANAGLGLGYAVSPVGPRWDIAEHDWDYDDEDPAWPHAMALSRTLGILAPIPMEELSPRKVRQFGRLYELWSAFDALLVCVFAAAPTRLLSLEDVAALVRAVTGWETSSYEVMRWGARRLQLMRVYNLREGLDASDDRLPERFFEDPIDSGPLAGARVDRGAFEQAVAHHYAQMGWDARGVPTETTLVEHHLEWTRTVPASVAGAEGP